MYTLSGDKIPVSVLIAPKIAPPIQYYVLTSFNNLPYVMGIKMAHPVIDKENFKASILIGADYYYTFVEVTPLEDLGEDLANCNWGICCLGHNLGTIMALLFNFFM